MRKNAVLAIFAMFKLPRGEMLLPDAPELIEKVCCEVAYSMCKLCKVISNPSITVARPFHAHPSMTISCLRYKAGWAEP